MKLYPLKFTPIFCYRIWGGEKLKKELQKNYVENNIGESWEISDVTDYETVVSNGELKGKTLRELIKEYTSEFVGTQVYNTFKNEFPLLIKFIDAKTPLSIQVHPSNELARERHNSFGKNEMWYIMQADDNAKLIVGFNETVEKEDYINRVSNGNLLDILNIEKVTKGDTFYIPTGRVHAIGAGVLLAEIQQTSNITYRIYDYDRVDSKTGEKRELHTDLAVDAIDYKHYENYKTNYSTSLNKSKELVHSPYFKTNILDIKGEIQKDYSTLDSFVIFMCVEGSAEILYKGDCYKLNLGETLLLPANIHNITINSSSGKVLEVHM
ncbi:type I phosphomannose isomerase catalytic subunit [Wenyingzhuangia sp. IMCC45574]